MENKPPEQVVATPAQPIVNQESAIVNQLSTNPTPNVNQTPPVVNNQPTNVNTPPATIEEPEEEPMITPPDETGLNEEQKAVIAEARGSLANLQREQKLKHPGGRPGIITEVTVVKLVAAFQSGMNVITACQYAGIDRDVFYRKMRNNTEFRGIIADARDSLALAAGHRLRQIITTGDERNATPLVKWYLEKSMPQEYGNSDKINPGNLTQNNFYGFTSEQARQVINGETAAQNTDPAELLEAIEKQSGLDNGAEAQSPAPVHTEEVQRNDPQQSNMPQPPVAV